MNNTIRPLPSGDFEVVLPAMGDSVPLFECTFCGRKSWDEAENGARCNMPQPDGARCLGTMARRTS